VLADLGYRNVRDYEEGKLGWINAGFPIEGHSRRLSRTTDI
jgi:hypothetical protein